MIGSLDFYYFSRKITNNQRHIKDYAIICIVWILNLIDYRKYKYIFVYKKKDCPRRTVLRLSNKMTALSAFKQCVIS